MRKVQEDEDGNIVNMNYIYYVMFFKYVTNYKT